MDVYVEIVIDEYGQVRLNVQNEVRDITHFLTLSEEVEEDLYKLLHDRAIQKRRGMDQSGMRLMGSTRSPKYSEILTEEHF